MSAPSDRRLAPPSGWAPPPEYREQAQEVCRRHFQMHPDQVERYGEHGMAWCVHDLQYVLSWAAGDAQGHTDLEIAADVVPEFGARLREVAGVVRELAA